MNFSCLRTGADPAPYHCIAPLDGFESPIQGTTGCYQTTSGGRRRSSLAPFTPRRP